jgi:hypothetical protein
MPDRSKVMTQTKRDIHVIQGGGWGEAKNLTSVTKILFFVSLIMNASWIVVVKWQRKVIRIMTSIFLLKMYSVCRK